jgi:hypothetical protein
MTMQLNLIPVTANPNDFKSITEKMKAQALQAHKSYSEFTIADQVSLDPAQREGYAKGLSNLDWIRKEASGMKVFDNSGLKSTTGFVDRNSDANELSGVFGDGTRLEISYDGSGSVRSYSELSDPQKTKAPDRLFQESNESIVVTVCQRSGEVDGLLFNKLTHQGTIFRVQ